MLILVLNSGSSSLKYKLFEIEKETVLASGVVERIGSTNGNSVIGHQKMGSDKLNFEEKISNHAEALKFVFNLLTDEKTGSIKSLSEIKAVGHRVLHGGELFSGAVIVDDDAMAKIESLRELGPLHMPANIMGIVACKELMKDTPQIAVFDTAFHQTMPRSSYLYALPYVYYEKYGVRRYGFHGTSHRYVNQEAGRVLGKNTSKMKLVTLHLGNGSSAAAIKDGKCFDTSMGFTPLEGMVMGTRCGDMDPAVVAFLQKKLNLSPDEVDNVMNKQSGFLGVAGVSDLRDIQKARLEGNERAVEVYEIFVQRIVKYVGAYAAEMGGLDAIIFTAGIGENDWVTRDEVCKRLSYMGVEIDARKNEGLHGKEAVISKSRSKIMVAVIPTNEELLIARDSYDLVK